MKTSRIAREADVPFDDLSVEGATDAEVMGFISHHLSKTRGRKMDEIASKFGVKGRSRRDRRRKLVQRARNDGNIRRDLAVSLTT